MICFCADEFHWRRIWQSRRILLSDLLEMAFRALLYRRPTEPRTLAVKIGSSTYTRFSSGAIAARADTRFAFIRAGAKPFSPCLRAEICMKPRTTRNVTAPGSPRGLVVCRKRRSHTVHRCHCAVFRTRSCIARACVEPSDGNARKRDKIFVSQVIPNSSIAASMIFSSVRHAAHSPMPRTVMQTYWA